MEVQPRKRTFVGEGSALTQQDIDERVRSYEQATDSNLDKMPVLSGETQFWRNVGRQYIPSTARQIPSRAGRGALTAGALALSPVPGPNPLAILIAAHVAGNAGMGGKDMYVPSTGTVNLKKGLPSTLAHEIGHWVDFEQNKGPYKRRFLRGRPDAPINRGRLPREMAATLWARKAMGEDEWKNAKKDLYPALATYMFDSKVYGRGLLDTVRGREAPRDPDWQKNLPLALKGQNRRAKQQAFQAALRQVLDEAHGNEVGQNLVDTNDETGEIKFINTRKHKMRKLVDTLMKHEYERKYGKPQLRKAAMEKQAIDPIALSTNREALMGKKKSKRELMLEKLKRMKQQGIKTAEYMMAVGRYTAVKQADMSSDLGDIASQYDTPVPSAPQRPPAGGFNAFADKMQGGGGYGEMAALNPELGWAPLAGMAAGGLGGYGVGRWLTPEDEEKQGNDSWTAPMMMGGGMAGGAAGAAYGGLKGFQAPGYDEETGDKKSRIIEMLKQMGIYGAGGAAAGAAIPFGSEVALQGLLATLNKNGMAKQANKGRLGQAIKGFFTQPKPPGPGFAGRPSGSQLRPWASAPLKHAPSVGVGGAVTYQGMEQGLDPTTAAYYGLLSGGLISPHTYRLAKGTMRQPNPTFGQVIGSRYPGVLGAKLGLGMLPIAVRGTTGVSRMADEMSQPVYRAKSPSTGELYNIDKNQWEALTSDRPVAVPELPDDLVPLEPLRPGRELGRGGAHFGRGTAEIGKELEESAPHVKSTLENVERAAGGVADTASTVAETTKQTAPHAEGLVTGLEETNRQMGEAAKGLQAVPPAVTQLGSDVRTSSDAVAAEISKFREGLAAGAGKAVDVGKQYGLPVAGGAAGGYLLSKLLGEALIGSGKSDRDREDAARRRRLLSMIGTAGGAGLGGYLAHRHGKQASYPSLEKLSAGPYPEAQVPASHARYTGTGMSMAGAAKAAPKRLHSQRGPLHNYSASFAKGDAARASTSRRKQQSFNARLQMANRNKRMREAKRLSQPGGASPPAYQGGTGAIGQ